MVPTFLESELFDIWVRIVNDKYDAIGHFSKNISSNILENLNDRTDDFRLGDGFETTTNTVFSTLLARQASLAEGLAESPLTWNGHIAPLVLRSMIDLLITFRWIVCSPTERSTEYVNYGLGMEKLLVSHYQSLLANGEDDTDDDRELAKRVAEANLAWIESQQFQMFVAVNLGSWTGMSVRKMCEETGSQDLYKFAYTPYSSATHNMWNHVGKWNAKFCRNPMHKQHMVGQIIDAWPVVDFMYRACKYYEQTLIEFDRFYDFESSVIPPTACFEESVGPLAEVWNAPEGAESDDEAGP